MVWHSICYLELVSYSSWATMNEQLCSYTIYKVRSQIISTERVVVSWIFWDISKKFYEGLF